MDGTKRLQVKLGERSYPIHIGQQLLAQTSNYLQEIGLDNKRKVLIITDGQVASFYAAPLQTHLEANGYTVLIYAVPAGEASKSLTVYEQIMTFALQNKYDRQSMILALGGGVVGDLAGFVASTFMRGVPFVQLPTTLLAHDSSVGGKVAINHALGKNLIGSFYQPLAVIYDTSCLATLSQREVSSGFAEIVKHGFIKDSSFVDWILDNLQPLRALQEPQISEAILRACQIKSDIVSNDETEQGMRALLNFGHTFGHAFEALGKYGEHTHGEAISIGMVLAARVSEVYYKQTNIVDQIQRLLQTFDLPVDHRHLPWSFEQVLDKMYADKKVFGQSLNLVLMPRLGEARIVNNVDPAIIKSIW